ncbi:MAG: D-tyrosyl-tRNA(Tyr) deacylase [Armatimonadota bacterium]|nr:MAG: D-tyrosyl-tRNA(Tyr) deacylase [Armatimonadota bacterium]
MRAVVQRAAWAKVAVGEKVTGEIGCGLAVLVGVQVGDTPEDAAYLSDKIAGLRVFEDADGKMNLSLQDVGGAILAVSNFTLLGDCRKGRRPSFTEAAPPEEAERLFGDFVERVRAAGLTVATGVFREHMHVEIHNDGPVTLILDSRRA